MKYSNQTNTEDQSQKTEEKNIEDKQLRYIELAAIALVLFVLFLVAMYSYNFGKNGISDSNAHWGAFGDFIGGLTNPLIGLVTVFLILHSVRIQRKELKASLDEIIRSNDALAIQNKAITRQGFEQTFFSWLSSYRNIVDSVISNTFIYSVDGILHSRTGRETKGRDALRSEWSLDLNSELGQVLYSLRNHFNDDCLNISEIIVEKLSANDKAEVFNIIVKHWNNIYLRSEHHLDALFRTLYRLIKWIDEQDSSVLSDQDKWHYISLIRAQISKIEMTYLFYNGFTERGMKFNELINTYALFDNLNIATDAVMQLMYLLDRSSIDGSSYKPTAFNSDLARQEKS